MAKCRFCSNPIEQGRGLLFVQKDGRAINFCSSKCEKNMLKLKRKASDRKWSKDSGK